MKRKKQTKGKYGSDQFNYESHKGFANFQNRKEWLEHRN